MADAAAKRELRRRRILENSESRLQRITGRIKEKSTEEKSNDGLVDKNASRSDNGFVNTNHSFITESEAILEEKHKDFLMRDNNLDFRDSELNEFDVLYQESDDFTTNHSNLRYTLKEDTKDYELNLNPKTAHSSKATLEPSQHSFLYNFFFSPLASVLLAAIVNILIIANVDFTLYKGILIPYFIMVVTRLCLGNKSEESQGSSMLMAALILCNIKPEIVRTLKKIMSFYSMTFKDFAVYLTSFVLIHWIISLFREDLSHLQFF